MIQVKQVNGAVTGTTGITHVYANGSTGSDSNDGLSALTPKENLQAALDILPDEFNDICIVHMAGTFTDQTCYVAKTIKHLNGYGITPAGGVLFFDGGTDRTDFGGGVKVTSGSSTSSLVVGGAGWGVDAYVGYIARVLTGAAAGQERTIVKNTADTITPYQNFSVDPGVGATFDIVRPTTTWTSTVGSKDIFLAGTSNGVIFFQNLTITGSSKCISISEGCRAEVRLSGIISTAAITTAFSASNNVGCIISMNGNTYDSTGTYDSSRIIIPAFIGAATSSTIHGATVRLTNCIFRHPLVLRGCTIYNLLESGSRALSAVTLENCKHYYSRGSNKILRATAGYYVSTIENSIGIGLRIYNTDCSLGEGSISNCGSHGVEVMGSNVYMVSTGGSSNTGAGMYAHAGSVILIMNGSTPTLTGTVGDLAISNGAIEESTWATIDGGTKVVVADELTMAKEV